MDAGILTFARSTSCTVVLYTNGLNSNSTITYGTTSNYTAVFTASTSGGGANAPGITYYLYVNGLLAKTVTTGQNPSGATVLNDIKLRSAGNVIIVANSSGANTGCISVRSQTIQKAVITQILKAFPSDNYSYDKTSPIIQDIVSGPEIGSQTGLEFKLYNGSAYTGLTHGLIVGNTAFNFSGLSNQYAQASSYHFYSRSSGNTNYSASNSSVLNVDIGIGYPSLNISLEPISSNPPGVLRGVTFSVSSINNQLQANATVNGVPVGTTNSTFHYDITSPGVYTFEFYTLGNLNYAPAYTMLVENITHSTSNATPSPSPIPPPVQVYPVLTTINLRLLDGSIAQESWLVYHYNDSYIRLTSKMLYASNYAQIPIPTNSFGLTYISLATSAPIPAPTIEISSPRSALCGSTSLSEAFVFFNSTDFLGEESSAVTNVSYYFELQKEFIDEQNFNSSLISMFICNQSKGVWQALNTTQTYATKTSIGFVGTSTGMSLYAIAFNVSQTNNTLPPEVKIRTIVTQSGLPNNYAYNATFANSTRSTLAQYNMSFYTPTLGVYYLKAYSVSNSSKRYGSLCRTTYTPNNLGSGANTTVDAGSVFVINYSSSTICSVVGREFTSSDMTYLILSIMVIVIIVFLVMLRIKASKL